MFQNNVVLAMSIRLDIIMSITLLLEKKHSVTEATSRLLWRADVPSSDWLLVQYIS